MGQRRFEHADNPGFRCEENVVLLPFGWRGYLPAILELAGGEELELDETTDRRAFALTAAPAPTTLIFSGMGSPAAANALEMAAANGARRLVVLGACGGADPEVGVGDLVAIHAAVRGEGTSPYYAPPGFPAAFDPVLTAALRRHAAATGLPLRTGVAYTTDTGYRQGSELYEACRGLVVAVECECAAVAVVSARLGLTAGALLFCTDNVLAGDRDDRRYRGLSDPRVRGALAAALGATLEALAEADASEPPPGRPAADREPGDGPGRR